MDLVPPVGVPSAQDPRPGGTAITLSIRSCLLSPFPFSSMMCQLSVVESKSATFPSEKARHLLDDSVLESRSPRRGLALTSSSAVTNGLSLGKRLQPARHRGGHSPARAHVCLSLCSTQWPLAPAGSAPCRSLQNQEGLCFLASRASPSPGAWAYPHAADGPALVREVEGTARRAPETRRRGSAAASAGLLSQRAGQSGGGCLRTAADGPPGSHVSLSSH